MEPVPLILEASGSSLEILEEVVIAAGFVYRHRSTGSEKGFTIGTGEGGSEPNLRLKPTRPAWPGPLAHSQWLEILEEAIRDETSILSGYEACTRLHGLRDATCRPGSYCPWLKNPFAATPLMNWLVERFRQRVVIEATKLGMQIKQVRRWPDSKQYALVLTHDVDLLSLYSLENARVFFRIATARKLGRDISPSFYRRLVNLLKSVLQLLGTASLCLRGKVDSLWNLHDWLALEQALGVRSTFFVAPYPEKGDRDPPYTAETEFFFHGRRITLSEWIKFLIDRGWEIGLHGSLASATSADQIVREAELVRRLTGNKNIGNRQHHLYYYAGKTEKAHAKAGLIYDTSLGYNEILGFRNASALPFYPRANGVGGKSSVLQIPLVVHDSAFYYKKYDFLESIHAARQIIQEVKRSSGCGALLFHPGMTNKKLLAMGFKVYQTLLSELANDETLWLTTAGELSQWWLKRANLCRSQA